MQLRIALILLVTLIIPSLSQAVPEVIVYPVKSIIGSMIPMSPTRLLHLDYGSKIKQRKSFQKNL